MKVNFNLTGRNRKELVTAIGGILGKRLAYKGAPTFAYEADGFVVDKEGTLCIDESVDKENAESLLQKLKGMGFTYDKTESGSGDGRLAIKMPIDGFTDTTLVNLERIVQAKGNLMKKALDVETLSVEQTETAICFPWFLADSTAEEIKAYTHFISAICNMAKTQQRINASSKDVGNEKYAFRCFLLRLGFIGQEYKGERKILLSKLTGSSAFRNGTPENVEDAQ